MKLLSAALAGTLAAAPFALSPLAAEPAAAPAASFMGTWALDLDSMAIPPQARPTSVTVAFECAGVAAHPIRTTYVITAPDGSERRMVSHEALDGTAVAIEGDQLEADSAALSSPAPGVLVMGLAKGGRPGSVRVYTVAADGRSMIESAANVGDDGKPFVRSFRWQRVGAGGGPCAG